MKKYRPFCSERCANRDLGAWLRGDYAIPSSRLDDAEEVADALEEAQDAGSGKPH
ncbi:DNA gyrase inhibitor YacG [Roseovarius sp. B08]|uniref:DNA gyrase inhibitor YacG n=1 Tax=Roseovarius sp. B08 TaxID=3449223 RepID=UPI003EDC71D2